MNFLFDMCSPKKKEKDSEIQSSIAQEVLDLEIKYNFHSSLKNLTSLMSAYTKGIEFYDSIRSPKSRYYSERLNDLLSNPETSKLMNEMNSEKSKKYKQKDLYLDRTTELTLNHYYSDVNILNNEIHLNLKNQSENLNKRLEERKKKKMLKNEENANKSFSTFKIEKYEEEVEGIIDKYTEEKILVKTKIDEEYQKFVEELNGGSEIIEKLKVELRKNMQLECTEKLTSLEEKKKTEIVRVRKRFLSLQF